MGEPNTNVICHLPGQAPDSVHRRDPHLTARQGQFKSARKTAIAYDVPPSTVSDRLRGVRPRRDAQMKNQKLTATEETALVQWILSMDERGMPPTAAYTCRMANLLLSERGKDLVGENWVRRFVGRRDEIKAKYSRRYDCQRAKCEDPQKIQEWFKEDPRIHCFGERYGYPLFAALANGNKDAVAALLNSPSSICNGVDITEGLNCRKDLKEYKNRTPLSWAAQDGRAGIVKLLLQTGTTVNEVDLGRQTSLSRASENGYEAVARVLIDKGADVNASDKYGWTPLLWATKNGYEAVAGLLIDKGADVNASDTVHIQNHILNVGQLSAIRRT